MHEQLHLPKYMEIVKLGLSLEGDNFYAVVTHSSETL